MLPALAPRLASHTGIIENSWAPNQGAWVVAVIEGDLTVRMSPEEITVPEFWKALKSHPGIEPDEEDELLLDEELPV